MRSTIDDRYDLSAVELLYTRHSLHLDWLGINFMDLFWEISSTPVTKFKWM